MRKKLVRAKPVPRSAVPPSRTADRAKTKSRSRLRPPRVLTYVDAVARYGSIRKAADALSVASSALNRQILDLEIDLGAPLFERLPRGVRVTSAGEAFLVYARLVISELKAVESRITTATGQKAESDTARFKGIITMYEGMKPKDAARVFDRLEMSVLLDIASQIAPRKMSDILGLMMPEAAERLTVELARRAGSDKSVSAAELPKIEGKVMAPKPN